MKRRRLAVGSIFMMTVISAAVLSLSPGLPARAAAANIPDALQHIPADYQFVSGLDVRRLTTSPFYLKLRQEQPQVARIGNELSEFTAQTGIDPARDISYLVMAGRSGASVKPEGLVILSGDFDKNRIVSFLRSQSGVIAMEYGGASVMMIPDKKDNSVKNGMVFLGENEIAMGNLVSLKAALDTKAGGKSSILSNAVVSSLLSSINLDGMFWFAGDAAGAMRQSPLLLPPALNASSIQSIAGVFDLGDDFVGKIMATTVDSNSAAKLADVFRGFLALGQLSGEQNPELQLLLSTVTVTQNSAQLSLSIHIPGDLIKKLGRIKSMQPGTI
jgi:hypothetical protein